MTDAALFAAADLPAPEIPITEQITCVQREIRMREEVYARRVLENRMSQKTADRELALMRAVLATLINLKGA